MLPGICRGEFALCLSRKLRFTSMHTGRASLLSTPGTVPILKTAPCLCRPGTGRFLRCCERASRLVVNVTSSGRSRCFRKCAAPLARGVLEKRQVVCYSISRGRVLRKEVTPMLHFLRAVLVNVLGRLLASLIKRLFG